MNSKKSFLIILMGITASVFFAGCSSDNTGEKADNTKQREWYNLIYDRIGTAPVDGGLQMEDYWVWGSAVVKGDDSLYHMYASRWPKKNPFHPGWMVASEIVHAVSETPEGPYEFKDIALGARGAQYWDGRSVFNPQVVKYNDLYVLFYAGTTYPFDDVTNPDTLKLGTSYPVVARSNKRVGIATSKSPYGPWERRDTPALETKPNTFYSFLTSNPTPWINEDGSVILMFKSRAYRDKYPYQSRMQIGMATAPDINSVFEVVSDEPVFSEDKFGIIEDPFIWKDESGYHMIAKDQYGKITNHHHAGVMAHSNNGIDWELDKQPLAYERVINWSDGKSIKMGQLERPFGLIENGKVTHLFFATMDGLGGFNRSTKSWNMVLPLK
ncbi:glycoside hydrolase family protein [uncultured Sunxiuqinia sp.]|uniref:glycoside hydrolase family protein n=1 Tax=uncultured Sunxiuqinia sp. TaxID=1573825 RepID=UPI002618779A|nr:glycoside hydrolase family protein [uncultured Sunxiuqinia sp.]